ncbi:MAG: hypothetical protein DRQ10_08080 [Candidatus Hydrothermota bacterium]|nr:MAG: hypothetical protein DRQ10_08080 [Candidatus Hydrothermae bacterium]
MKFYDVTGRLVATPFNKVVDVGEYTVRVPSELRNGIYFVKIEMGGKKFSQKVVVFR